MLGISGEHLVILGVVLLIFGPRRLPELGHTLGKAFKNFKDSVSGVEQAAFRHLPPEQDPNKNQTDVNKPVEQTVENTTETKADDHSGKGDPGSSSQSGSHVG